MHITDEIRYIGVNDHQVDLFEGQYQVPHGMAYNSYLIVDDACAVMDTVDRHFAGEWLENLAAALAGRKPDYLVVQHMEPDHAGSILDFAAAYPEAVIVSSAPAFKMMENFFATDFSQRRRVVGEGDSLALGRHCLHFVAAPMVHWPEVIVSYDSADKVLFSADGFGKFGALDAEAEDWACEARRYYFGIVGKFGPQVQALLKKAAALDIQTICPLHGPVLTENLGYYVNLYDRWSRYEPEDAGVCLAYASVYGGTRAAAEALAAELEARGCTVALTDLARCDMAEAVEDAFRYDRLVLAAPTYNGDLFPVMREFIQHLTARAFQNRTVALVENGSWAPRAAAVMRAMLEGCKDLRFARTQVRLLSVLNEAGRAQIAALAAELCETQP